MYCNRTENQKWHSARNKTKTQTEWTNFTIISGKSTKCARISSILCDRIKEQIQNEPHVVLIHRSRRCKSTRRRFCKWQTSTRRSKTTNRRASPQWCSAVRYIKTITGQPRLCIQNIIEVRHLTIVFFISCFKLLNVLAALAMWRAHNISSFTGNCKELRPDPNNYAQTRRLYKWGYKFEHYFNDIQRLWNNKKKKTQQAISGTIVRAIYAFENEVWFVNLLFGAARWMCLMTERRSSGFRAHNGK